MVVTNVAGLLWAWDQSEFVDTPERDRCVARPTVSDRVRNTEEGEDTRQRSLTRTNDASEGVRVNFLVKHNFCWRQKIEAVEFRLQGLPKTKFLRKVVRLFLICKCCHSIPMFVCACVAGLGKVWRKRWKADPGRWQLSIRRICCR